MTKKQDLNYLSVSDSIKKHRAFEEHKKKIRWLRVLSCLAPLVILYVFYALSIPAKTATNEPTCGLQEHLHNEGCYGDESELICSIQEHKHELKLCYKQPLDSSADIEIESEWTSSFSNITLTGDYSLDVLAIAQSQLGYNESTLNYMVDDAGNVCGYSRYGAWRNQPYANWNTLFAGFCIYYSGIEDFPIAENGVELLNKIELSKWNNCRITDISEIKPGDLLFVKNGDNAIDLRVVIVDTVVDLLEDFADIRVFEGDVCGAVVYNESTYSLSQIAGIVRLNKRISDECENNIDPVADEDNSGELWVQIIWEDGEENHSNEYVTVYLTNNGQRCIPERKLILSDENEWNGCFNGISISDNEEIDRYGVEQETIDGYLTKYFFGIDDAGKNQNNDLPFDTDMIGPEIKTKVDNDVAFPQGTVSFSQPTMLLAEAEPMDGLEENSNSEINRLNLISIVNSPMALNSPVMEHGSNNVVIKAKKEWVPSTSATNSVTVKIFNGEDEVGEMVLNPGNNWSAEINTLPRYNADGSEIEYTLQEVNNPLYESKILYNDMSYARTWTRETGTNFVDGASYIFVGVTYSYYTYKYYVTSHAADTLNSIGEITLTDVQMNTLSFDALLNGLNGSSSQQAVKSPIPDSIIWTAQKNSNDTWTFKNEDRKRNLYYYYRYYYNGYYYGDNEWYVNGHNNTGNYQFNVIENGGKYNIRSNYYTDDSSNDLFGSQTSDYRYAYRMTSETPIYDYVIKNRKIDKIEKPEVTLEHNKRIDSLWDYGKVNNNVDSELDDQISGFSHPDLYRLYLDVQGTNDPPVDLLLVLDRSYSMADYKDYKDADGNYIERYKAVLKTLSGDGTTPGYIARFVASNPDNRYAIIDFGGAAYIGDDPSNGLLGFHADPNGSYEYTDDAKIIQNWISGSDPGSSAGLTENEYKGLASNGTNYAAGLQLANWMFGELTKSDGGVNPDRRRIMVFLSDGMPTFYIAGNGDRCGNGNDATEEYENVVNCNLPSKLAFDAFLKNNPEVETYTVALKGTIAHSFDTDVLEYMSTQGNGKLFESTGNDSVEELMKTLENISLPKDVVIKDVLSEYVDFYREQPEVKFTFQKIKLDEFKEPVKNPDGTLQFEEDPITVELINTLNEPGGEMMWKPKIDATNNFHDNTPVLKEIVFTPASEENPYTTGKIIAEFEPEYGLKYPWIYTLSFNVKTSDKAIEEYKNNKYSGVVGEEDTDYKYQGNHNETSSFKLGFYSNWNENTNVSYTVGIDKKSELYQKPVVQVTIIELPETGGVGTTIYAIGGLTLMSVALRLMYKTKYTRKKEGDE